MPKEKNDPVKKIASELKEMKQFEKEEEIIEKEVEMTQDKIERILDRLARSGLKDYLDYLSSPPKIFLSNFLAGIGRGLGFVIGATVVLSFVVFLIGTILSQIPVIGNFFHWLDQFLQQSLQQRNGLPPS